MESVRIKFNNQIYYILFLDSSIVSTPYIWSLYNCNKSLHENKRTNFSIFLWFWDNALLIDVDLMYSYLLFILIISMITFYHFKLKVIIMTSPRNLEHAVYMYLHTTPLPFQPLHKSTNNFFGQQYIHVHANLVCTRNVSLYTWSARANAKSSAIPLYEGQ